MTLFSRSSDTEHGHRRGISTRHNAVTRAEGAQLRRLRIPRPFLGFPLALGMLLLTISGVAFGQTPVEDSPRDWHIGVVFVSSNRHREPNPQLCDAARFSQGGRFCTSALSEGMGPLASVGRRLTPRLSAEVEAGFDVWATRGTATYYRYAGHFDTDRTDAAYAHREFLVSGLVRLNAAPSKARFSLAPVAGLTMGRASDRLTEQVRVLSSSAVTFSATSYPASETASNVAIGATGGVDVGVAVSAQASVVGIVRVRWVPWGTETWVSAGRQTVGVGRVSVQVGGGVRWSSQVH